jgi:hypothetical protein
MGMLGMGTCRGRAGRGWSQARGLGGETPSPGHEALWLGHVALLGWPLAISGMAGDAGDAPFLPGTGAARGGLWQPQAWQAMPGMHRSCRALEQPGADCGAFRHGRRCLGMWRSCRGTGAARGRIVAASGMAGDAWGCGVLAGASGAAKGGLWSLWAWKAMPGMWGSCWGIRSGRRRIVVPLGMAGEAGDAPFLPGRWTRSGAGRDPCGKTCRRGICVGDGPHAGLRTLRTCRRGVLPLAGTLPDVVQSFRNPPPVRRRSRSRLGRPGASLPSLRCP